MTRSMSSIRSLVLRSATIAIALTMQHVPALAQTQLTAESEVFDGEIHDVATQYDATSGAADKRAWVAQGSVRAALRLSNRERMPLEDTKFNRVDPAVYEGVWAVEVDDVNGYLYTLTDGALYRETIAGLHSPMSPGDSKFLKFVNGPLQPPLSQTPVEILQDVKLIPSTSSSQYVLVLTNLRPIVVKSDSNGLSLLPPSGGVHTGQSLELYDRATQGSPSYLHTGKADHTFDKLKVSLLIDATVEVDASGRTIAYLLAAFKKYPQSGRIGIVHNFCQVLILCDLDGGNGFASPTFDADPTGAVGYAYWDPYSIYTGAGSAAADKPDLRAHNVYDVVARVDSGQTQAFLACGSTRQLVEVAAPFSPGGMTEIATITLDSGEHWLEMHKDRSDPDRLHLHGSSRFVTCDVTSTPAVLGSVDDELLSEGGYGDMALALLPNVLGGTTTSIWVVGSNAIDHLLKVYDVSTSTPATLDEVGFLWTSDGAVALDFDNVYVPTWGGVRHYRRNSGVWGFGGYQPAEIMISGANKQFITEHIAIGSDTLGRDWVFIAANTFDAVAQIHRNGVLAYRLDSNHEPQAPVFLEIDPVTWFGWAQNGLFSNDVAFLSYGGESYVLIDITFHAGTPTDETGLVAFRWDTATSSWIESGYAKHGLPPDLPPPAPGEHLSNAIAVGTMASGAPAAFVGGDFGIASYDLSSIASSTPTIVSRTLLQSDPCKAIVAARSRLIVFYNQTTSSQPHVEIYDWNTSTGAINTTPVATYSSSSIPSTSSSTTSDWGSESFRARYDPINTSSGQVYVCNTKLFRLLYDATTTPPTLTYDAYWETSHGAFLQDSRIYTFGGTKTGDTKLVLVAKEKRAFAWLIP